MPHKPAAEDLVDHHALDYELLHSFLVTPHGPLKYLEVLDQVDSTNTYLADKLAASPEADLLPALVVAEAQTAGRGRSGRTWQTSVGTSLICSVALTTQVPPERRSWLPLMAGLAVVRALRSTLGVPAVAKWPNDILVPTGAENLPGWLHLRKLGGILVQGVGPDTYVVGLGVNVTTARADLPVATATSLVLAGVRDLNRNMLLTSFATSVTEIMAQWRAAGGDPEAAGLVAEIAAVSATIGARVRVELVGGAELVGTATGLAPDGGLKVLDDGGETHVVHAGDVYHLRLH